MTDDELVAAFRDATLAHLPHRLHVRLAWIYLEAQPHDAALARFAGDLQRYAAAHGAAGKYSDAITRAWMARIDARRGPRTWDEFAAANADLLAR